MEDEQIERLQGTDLATVTFEVSWSTLFLRVWWNWFQCSKAIQYLENKVQPTVQQTAGNIVTLLSGLSQERLNKAEMLQIVNLAPTRLVEMVVVSFLSIFFWLTLLASLRSLRNWFINETTTTVRGWFWDEIPSRTRYGFNY